PTRLPTAVHRPRDQPPDSTRRGLCSLTPGMGTRALARPCPDAIAHGGSSPPRSASRLPPTPALLPHARPRPPRSLPPLPPPPDAIAHGGSSSARSAPRLHATRPLLADAGHGHPGSRPPMPIDDVRCPS